MSTPTTSTHKTAVMMVSAGHNLERNRKQLANSLLMLLPEDGSEPWRSFKSHHADKERYEYETFPEFFNDWSYHDLLFEDLKTVFHDNPRLLERLARVTGGAA